MPTYLYSVDENGEVSEKRLSDYSMIDRMSLWNLSKIGRDENSFVEDSCGIITTEEREEVVGTEVIKGFTTAVRENQLMTKGWDDLEKFFNKVDGQHFLWLSDELEKGFSLCGKFFERACMKIVPDSNDEIKGNMLFIILQDYFNGKEKLEPLRKILSENARDPMNDNEKYLASQYYVNDPKAISKFFQEYDNLLEVKIPAELKMKVNEVFVKFGHKDHCPFQDVLKLKEEMDVPKSTPGALKRKM